MSELQLGLLAIGAVLVAGVFAYNRYQEKTAQRSADRNFRSAHPDVLLEPHGARIEPAPPPPKPPAAMPLRAETGRGVLPDSSVDYVVDLSFGSAQQASALAEQWKPNEHRYAGQVLLAACGGGASWRRLHAADPLPVESLRAGLQLVTRSRTVNDAQLIEFRAAVDALAGATGASIRAPEIRQAVETARELERFCDDCDIQVVIHVAPSNAGLSSGQVGAAAANAGFTAGEDGRLAMRDGEGNLLYALSASDGTSLASHEHVTLPGVSLSLDVPRVPDFARVFRSMAAFAGVLARDVGGSLVDDNRNALDERALQAIAAQLDSVRAQFDARGIAPGSPAALRLFS